MDAWSPMCNYRMPMALSNDNFWGYTTDIITRFQVRWIEAAIVTPCWTNMLVYYVEGDRGHLMNEQLGKQVMLGCAGMGWHSMTCDGIGWDSDEIESVVCYQVLNRNFKTEFIYNLKVMFVIKLWVTVSKF